MSTPRAFYSEPCCKAQIHALEKHSKDLERLLGTAGFLTQCVKENILKTNDKDSINRNRNPSAKLKILLSRIQDHPNRYNQLIGLLKRDPKNKQTASAIDATKNEKETELKEQFALKELTNILGKQLYPAIFGRKLNCNDQKLFTLVPKFEEMANILHKVRNKIEPEGSWSDETLTDLLENQESSGQLKINQVQKANENLETTIESLTKEKLELEDEIQQKETEVINRKFWIKRMEDNMKELEGKCAEYEDKLSKCSCTQYPFPSGQQVLTADEIDTDALGQMPTSEPAEIINIQGHRSTENVMNRKLEQDDVNNNSNDKREHHDINIDQETALKMVYSANEDKTQTIPKEVIIITEKNYSHTTSSFDLQQETWGALTIQRPDTASERNSPMDSLYVAPGTRQNSEMDDSVFFDDDNKLSDDEADIQNANVAKGNKNVIINYNNCVFSNTSSVN